MTLHLSVESLSASHYTNAIKQGPVVIKDDKVLVVSKPRANGEVQIMIVQDWQSSDPWYCYMYILPDTLFGLLLIVPGKMSITKALCTHVYSYVDQITEYNCEHTGVVYSMPRESALKLFGEDWRRYL